MGNSPSTLSTTPPASSPALSSPKSPPKKPVFYLMLDVDTTSEDMPQLVTIEAEMYRLQPNNTLHLVGQVASIVKPKKGYAVLRLIQDLRYHGITAEMMADHGDDPVEALGNLLQMIRETTGKASLAMDDDEQPRVMVVGHGTQGMITNLMAAARADETLHGYWEELEQLCQLTDDTLPLCVRELTNLKRASLEWCVAALGLPLSKTRARAIAQLYVTLQNFTVDDEW